MDSRARSPQDGPRELFGRLQGAILNDYDMNDQADLFASDGVVEWPFAPPSLPRRTEGREAIREVLVPLGDMARLSGRRLLGYSSLVIHDTIDPNEIVVEFNVEGEQGTTGQRYRLPYIQVLRVRDGEIVLLRDYWNPQALATLLANPSESRAAAPLE